MVNLTLSRHNHLNGFRTTGATPNEAMAPVGFASGSYIMQYSIGTPPTPTWGFVDTASAIIWLQCQPCKKCYNQKDPIFYSRNSSSYRKIGCDEDECEYSHRLHCSEDDHFCQYGMYYEDRTYSNGHLSAETLTFRDQQSKAGKIILLHILFGCGHDNSDGLKLYDTPAGVVGFNNEKLSLISQTGFNGFSHCFIPKDSSLDSPLHMGDLAIFEGGRTPILSVGFPDYYYVGLHCISVGNDCLPVPSGTFNVTMERKGGFVVDSGTLLTQLRINVYELLKEKVIQMTKGLRQVKGTPGLLELCYRGTIAEIEKKTPPITFHFTGVALTMSGLNAWIPNGRGQACLAMLPGDNAFLISILGSYQLQNINVGYNVRSRFISFKPMDCTKL
ncbi:probable aspartic protease At2g35615 [Telopea speciosissima]|uniref:probable aspartic protease At2g35615 n=1 Tax=Telopea speciosissima TaxID=54955 RepID=UPI001CC6FD88|nr:probable aspartic protease At2g35615 [Telopea speciosissima]